MMRKLMICMALLVCLGVGAQQKRSSQKGRARTTVQQGKQQGKQGAKASGKQQKGKKGKKGAKGQTYTTDEIKGLQTQRTKIQQEIKVQQGKLQANKADVAQRLQNLMVINSEIDDKQKAIEGFETEIKGLDNDIGILRSQVSTLQRQLDERKEKYVKSMRYMGKYRTIQDKLMFIFSSKSLTQAYRRLRFVREYAAYQRAQGELIKQKQEELNQKNRQLQKAKGSKNQLLNKGKEAQRELQSKQDEQLKAVDGLQREQKTIQGLIAEHQQKDAQINAEIDRLVAIEVEKARKRAEAERKAAEEARKKAAAEAARKKAEEARKKAEAEAAAREAERRIAAAKAEEARRKAAAEEAARVAREAERKAEAERRAAAEAERRAAAEQEAAERRRAEREEAEARRQQLAAEREQREKEQAAEAARQAAREAEAARQAAERKAAAERERAQKAERAAAAAEEESVALVSTTDRRISGSFESNKGRLPMPASGRIVSHFGQYNVEGLTNVKLDNKGINILCSPGAQVRSIFDGEVSAVVSIAGQMVVMVRHGSYISVYCNLKSVSVRQGQKVSARQVLGTVGQDNILQFQLRKETAKLNPEQWLGR